MPMASPVDQVSIHDRLEQMLSGDPKVRLAAWFDLMGRGYQGLTIVDECCSRDGKPLHLKLNALNAHLRRLDNPGAIARRGRSHTAENTRYGDPEDDGYGPARGRGGQL